MDSSQWRAERQLHVHMHTGWQVLQTGGKVIHLGNFTWEREVENCISGRFGTTLSIFQKKTNYGRYICLIKSSEKMDLLLKVQRRQPKRNGQRPSDAKPWAVENELEDADWHTSVRYIIRTTAAFPLILKLWATIATRSLVVVRLQERHRDVKALQSSTLTSTNRAARRRTSHSQLRSNYHHFSTKKHIHSPTP